MRIHRRRFLNLTVAAAAIPAASRIAVAEAYPSRPIRLIVGFTAGAASDVIARIFAGAAGPFVGQQIVVENKPGAGSSIAAQYVARAQNDGYTLFLPALSTLTNEIVNPSSPPLDMTKDFVSIALLAEGPFFLTVNPALNLHSVADLVALAKAKPGELLYGSVGAGSLPHLCGELFAQHAGIKLVHVPYPGSPQTVTDLIAGRITMSFTVGSSILGQLGAGQLTALATTGGKRSGLLPNVPTMAEAGIRISKSAFGWASWRPPVRRVRWSTRSPAPRIKPCIRRMPWRRCTSKVMSRSRPGRMSSAPIFAVKPRAGSKSCVLPA
jgi:tripartite-type tricarboxylate transporter receptor subunit TctC